MAEPSGSLSRSPSLSSSVSSSSRYSVTSLPDPASFHHLLPTLFAQHTSVKGKEQVASTGTDESKRESESKRGGASTQTNESGQQPVSEKNKTMEKIPLLSATLLPSPLHTRRKGHGLDVYQADGGDDYDGERNSSVPQLVFDDSGLFSHYGPYYGEDGESITQSLSAQSMTPKLIRLAGLDDSGYMSSPCPSVSTLVMGRDGMDFPETGLPYDGENRKIRQLTGLQPSRSTAEAVSKRQYHRNSSVYYKPYADMEMSDMETKNLRLEPPVHDNHLSTNRGGYRQCDTHDTSAGSTEAHSSSHNITGRVDAQTKPKNNTERRETHKRAKAWLTKNLQFFDMPVSPYFDDGVYDIPNELHIHPPAVDFAKQKQQEEEQCREQQQRVSNAQHQYEMDQLCLEAIMHTGYNGGVVHSPSFAKNPFQGPALAIQLQEPVRHRSLVPPARPPRPATPLIPEVLRSGGPGAKQDGPSDAVKPAVQPSIVQDVETQTPQELMILPATRFEAKKKPAIKTRAMAEQLQREIPQEVSSALEPDEEQDKGRKNRDTSATVYVKLDLGTDAGFVSSMLDVVHDQTNNGLQDTQDRHNGEVNEPAYGKEGHVHHEASAHELLDHYEDKCVDEDEEGDGEEGDEEGGDGEEGDEEEDDIVDLYHEIAMEIAIASKSASISSRERASATSTSQTDYSISYSVPQASLDVSTIQGHTLDREELLAQARHQHVLYMPTADVKSGFDFSSSDDDDDLASGADTTKHYSAGRRQSLQERFSPRRRGTSLSQETSCGAHKKTKERKSGDSRELYLKSPDFKYSKSSHAKDKPSDSGDKSSKDRSSNKRSIGRKVIFRADALRPSSILARALRRNSSHEHMRSARSSGQGGHAALDHHLRGQPKEYHDVYEHHNLYEHHLSSLSQLSLGSFGEVLYGQRAEVGVGSGGSECGASARVSDDERSKMKTST